MRQQVLLACVAVHAACSSQPPVMLLSNVVVRLSPGPSAAGTLSIDTMLLGLLKFCPLMRLYDADEDEWLPPVSAPALQTPASGFHARGRNTTRNAEQLHTITSSAAVLSIIGHDLHVCRDRCRSAGSLLARKSSNGREATFGSCACGR